MPDLRVSVVSFEDGLDAWQAKVIEGLRALPGVTMNAMLVRPRVAGADFAQALHRKDRAVVALGGAQLCLGEAANTEGCDLVVNLTQGAPKGTGASGRLELDFDDQRAPGRHEVRRAAPVSTVRILHYFAEDRARVVAEAVLKTGRNERRNAANLLSATVLLISRAVVVVRDGLEHGVVSAPIALETSWERLHQRVARTFEKLLFRPRWTLGVVDASVADIVRQAAMPRVRLFCGLPRDRFFADPFVVRATRSRMTVLAESAALHPPFKGQICAIEASTRGRVLSVHDALATPEHLSFPFVLREGDEMFCVPERHQSGALAAYKVSEGEWTHETTLLHGVAAVDPVLLQHEGRWWLFCGDNAHDDTVHLYLYYSNAWRGPWTPHPLNPVKSDVRNSRPAGAIVAHDGVLYRPAQDCSRRYGGALVMNRITTLSETAFAEEEAFRVDPKKLNARFLGLHTINGFGDITVVDVLERRLAFT